MTLQLPIHTERLVVRRLQPSDLERFAAYRADPLLAQDQGWAPMTHDEAGAFIASMLTQPMLEPENWVQLAIANGTGDDLLGDIGLCLHENGDAEIGVRTMINFLGEGVPGSLLARMNVCPVDGRRIAGARSKVGSTTSPHWQSRVSDRRAEAKSVRRHAQSQVGSASPEAQSSRRSVMCAEFERGVLGVFREHKTRPCRGPSMTTSLLAARLMTRRQPRLGGYRVAIVMRDNVYYVNLLGEFAQPRLRRFETAAPWQRTPLTLPTTASLGC